MKNTEKNTEKNTKYIDICTHYVKKIKECEVKNLHNPSCELLRQLLSNCLAFQKSKNKQ